MKAIKLFLLTLLISGLSLSCSDHPDRVVEVPAMGKTSLNGIWEVAAGQETVTPETFRHQVPVPGYLDQADPRFPQVGLLENGANLLGVEKPDYTYFWYRTRFQLSTPCPPNIRLILHKAAFGSQIWLNGNLVGFHAPSYTPGIFDLGKFVRPGSNQLLVRIGASPDQSPAVSGIEPERKKMLPGIWDDVELLVSGSTFFEKFQIAPDPAQSRVRLHATARHTGGESNVEATCRIREWVSRKIVAETRLTLDFSQSDVTRLDTTISLGSFAPWSPENPFLYEASIKVDGNVLSERFGMRSFSGQMGKKPGTGRFLLNGREYFLRGSNICYGRWTEDPKRGSLPWNRQWVRELMEQWKDLNYNAFRCSIGPLPRLWYDIADEVGLLIQDEYAIWQLDLQRITVEQLAEEYRQWMSARWNHPSVVIFDAQNETLHGQNGSITGSAIGKVRHLDLSRRPWDNGWMPPVTKGDASERHPYLLSRAPGEGIALLHQVAKSGDRTGEFSKGIYLSPEGNYIPGGLSPLMAMEGYEQVMEWSRHPLIVNEFEWLWLSRDGQPIPERQYRIYAGTNASESERRALRARVTAAVTEFWRTSRTSAAVMNFEGLSFPGIIEGHSSLLHNTSDPYLDIQNLVLDPVFEKEIRDANAPTGLMLDFFHSTVPAETALDSPVILINDLDEGVTVRLEVTLRDEDDRTLIERRDEIVLPPLSKNRFPFSFTGPLAEGTYHLQACLNLDHGKTVKSRRSFQITTGEPLAIRVTDHVAGPVDRGLFGHFMERVQDRERGPEGIADPETGELPRSVEKAIRRLSPTLLRYPGGYVLELPEFRWSQLIDGAPDRDQSARPVTVDKNGRKHTNHFGLDEFLQLCERLEAEPLLVVKATDVARGLVPAEDIIEQAAAMVAYCNAPADGNLPPHLQQWANLRAANGRKKPYNVNLWQIGNEFAWVGGGPLRKRGLDDDAITEAFVDAVDRIAAAMHAVDPDINLIAEGLMEIPAVNIPVVSRLRERLGDRITYISSHRYHSGAINRLLREGEPIPADSLTQTEYWYAVVSSPGTLTAHGQTIFREVPFERSAQAGYRTALTEWNWNSWWALDPKVNPGKPLRESLWSKGVAAASIFHSILRSPQPVAIATQSMLVGNHWQLRSIDVATGQPIFHPSGQVTGLYSRYHGPHRMAWEPVGEWPTYDQPITLGQLKPSTGVALVDCVVTASSEHTFLHLINRSLDQSFTIQVESSALSVQSPGQIHRLQKVDDEWAARAANEEVGIESSLPLYPIQGAWSAPLPPACVQVVVLPRHP